MGEWSGLSFCRLCAIRNASVSCDGQNGSLGRTIVGLGEYNGFIWAGGLNKLWRWQPGPPRFYTLSSERR